MLKRKPNILILMADQMTPFALSAYGHHVTKTPNMDALAARGVVFDSAYCASPLCAPLMPIKGRSGPSAARVVAIA